MYNFSSQIILLFVCLNLFGNNSIDRFGVKNGLSSGFVFDFIQSKDGFIYLGLHTGLNRYDGYEVKQYKNNPFDPFSISPLAVNNLIEDERGLIWIGFESGELDVFNPKTGKFHHFGKFGEQYFEHHKIIQAITVDPNGDIWLGTLYGEIIKIDLSDSFVLSPNSPIISNESYRQTKFTISPNPNLEFYPNDSRNPIRNFTWDHDTNLWLTTADAQVYSIDYNLESVKLVFQSPDRDAEDPQLFLDNKKNFWYSDGKNWYKIEQQTAKKQTINPWYRHAKIYGSDTKGNLIYDIRTIGNLNSKVYKSPWANIQSNKVDTTFLLKHKTTLSRKLIIDHSGLFWIKDFLGVLKFNPKPRFFEHILKGKSIYQIYSDENGNVFTKIGKTFILINVEKTKIDDITKIYPTLNFTINDLVIKDNGDLLGRKSLRDEYGNYHMDQNPFFKIDKKSNKVSFYSLPDSLGLINEKSKLIIDKNNDFWGVVINPFSLIKIDLENGNYEIFNDKNFNEKRNHTFRLVDHYVDSFNDIWLLTTKGAIKTNSSLAGDQIEFKLKMYENDPLNPNSLNNNSIKSIYSAPGDQNHFIWFGTSGGGLNKYNVKTGEYSHFTTSNSKIPDDVVYQIQSDKQHNLWLSTNKGISKFNPSTNFFTNFTLKDGLQDLEFNSKSSLKVNDNTFYFGGVNGINRFKIKEYSEAAEPAVRKLEITGLTINNEALEIGKKGSFNEIIIEKDIRFLDEINLSFDQNNISIKFASLDFANVEKNIYEYQLLKEDYPLSKKWEESKWTELGKENYIKFYDLNPGTYTFKVKGGDLNEEWETEIRHLRFTIHPPWWWSTLAKGLYIVLTGFLFYVLFSSEVNKQKLQNELVFEAREADRLLELDRLKSNFFSNVSHEFRTPLTLILSPLQSLIKGENLNHNQKKLLKLVEKNGKNLQKLTNEILDLAKLESNSMVLNEEVINIYLISKRLLGVFESYAEKKKIKLSFECKLSPKLQILIDTKKFEKVVNNLLSNALKFTPKEGKVELSLFDLGHSIQIRVSDSGVGISEKELPNIFNRFYQSDNKERATYKGSGIGLAIVNEYVKLFEGKIEVESTLNKGSKFIFSFPKKEAFKQLVNEDAIEVLADNTIDSTYTKEIVVSDNKNSENQILVPSTNSKKDDKILIVEDNEQLLEYISYLFQENYKVIKASNGQEALDWLEGLEDPELYPSLILSDVMMPILNGIELLSKLKNNDKYFSIPVIMLTAKAALEDKLSALRIGVDDYITKPFIEDELLIRVQNLILNSNNRKSAKLEVEGENVFLPEDINDEETNINETVPINPKIEPSESSDIGLMEVEEFVPSKENLKWLEDLENLILENISNSNFTLETLGYQIYLSPRQIRRRLKALTGLTYSQYIKEARFSFARKLLEEGKVSSIKHLAIEVGVKDSKYFSKEFKKRFGKSPLKFLE